MNARVFFTRSIAAATVATLALLSLPSAGQESSASQAAARAYNAAAALQNNGLYERAAQKWGEFLAKFSNDSRADRANYYQGVCLLRSQKFAEAAKSFQTVLSRWPNFKDADGAQYNLGMALYETALASQKPDDFSKAAAALATVASKFPKSDHADRALYFQGDALYAAGDKQAAMAAFQKLVQGYPNSAQLARAYYDLGIVQQELQLDKEASATFAAFLNNNKFAQHELAPEIRLRLALSQYNLQEFAAAEKGFVAVAEQKDFPLADFALLRLGQCKIELGQLEQAAALLSDVPKRFPQSPYKAEALVAAGRCYFSIDKLTEARAALSALAGGAEPVAAEAAYWLGRTLLKQDQPQEALKTLENAAGRFKQGAFAPYLQLARIDALYELPERRQETPALYEAFVKQHGQHPLTPQATYMWALSALGEEKYPQARAVAESFLNKAEYQQHELYPAVMYIGAEATLLSDQSNAGNRQQAEKLYRSLVTRFPDHPRSPRAHLRIGWCLLTDEKFADVAGYLSGALPKLKEPEQQAEAHLLIGRSRAAAGDHGQAITALEAALRADAQWVRRDEVLLALAESLQQQMRLDDAAGRLNTLAKDFPQSDLRAAAFYQLGEIAQKQNKLDEAIRHFSQVVSQHADSQFAAAARYGLALAHFNKQDFGQTVAVLNALLVDETEPAVAARGRYLRGLAFQQQKEFAKAADDLTAFLQSQPEPPDLHDARYALALCRIGNNQLVEAEAALGDLLKGASNYEHADKVYYELGHALLKQQDKQPAAASAFRMLAEKMPESPLAAESWFHVGRFHEKAAEATDDEAGKKAAWSKASDAFAAGVKTAKAAELREKLLYKLGEMQFRQAEHATAAQTLQTQTKEFPNGDLYGPARYLAAESLFRADDFTAALPLFVDVANRKVENHHAAALYRAGDCAARLKQWSESEKHYSALIQLFGDFPQIDEARYGKAWALQNQNKMAEAVAQYEQVTELTETETAAKARFMIGEIAFAQKKYEEAIEHFLLVAVGYPYAEWQALARYEAGRCFRELGKQEEALRTWKELVNKHPDHPRAKDAARLIAELSK